MKVAWTRRIIHGATGTAVLLALAGPLAADDDQGPGFLGRLFRLGGSSSSSSSSSGSSTTPTSPPTSTRVPYSGSYGSSLPPGGASFGTTGNAFSPGGTGASAMPPAPLPTFGGLPETPPLPSSTGPSERLTPRPRTSPAVTSADPILTRFALGKSNDGSTFGMFMQIFADGTVVDSEGVHHVRPADLKPIFDLVQAGDLYRIRGHCGAPSTDFIEYVHVVIYERRLGRLQAHSFSYSGNPQACDHSIRHLHAAIENLQTKLSRPPVTTSPSIGSSPAPINPSSAIPSTSNADSVISLTPAGPSH
jgi:hypothetical protein